MSFKRWILPDIDKQLINELAEECNIEPFLALMAHSRGLNDPFAVDEFLSREIPDIDPYAIPDMEIAVSRINEAVQSEEKIIIYGDYDCDGVTSTALLYKFLTEMGADVSFYIPSRKNDGYGMNCSVIETFAQEGIKLIITVDNGISAIEEIDFANSLGIDTIVTDHHLPKETLPNALAVINPHRQDCYLEFKDFAGVGVAYILALATSGLSPETLLYKYSDFVALGTVADVMPIKKENRNIVWHGLRKINHNASVGIKALLAAAGAKFGEITAGVLAFTAAPRLNAAGRLGDASIAVQLLISENYADAMEIAANLDDENIRRQKIEQEIVEFAEEVVVNNKLYNNRVIVVAGENWHEGVLGIAAARIAEKFSRPTILLSRENESDHYKGSARTVGDFSIFDAINYCENSLVKFGGHAKAAGLTVEAEKLSEFTQKINEFSNNVDFPIPTIHIDCKINPVAVVPDLLYTLSPLEPYGTGNPKPIFGLFGMTLKSVSAIGNGKHIRIVASKQNQTVNMVSFGTVKENFPFSEGDVLDFAVSLEVKEYHGEEQISIFVKDVRRSEFSEEEALSQILLYESFLNNTLDKEDAEILCFERDELAVVYRAIKNGADTLNKLLQRVNTIINAKIRVMIDVMEELGLISVKVMGNDLKLKTLNTEKVNLENSIILDKLKQKAVKL